MAEAVRQTGSKETITYPGVKFRGGRCNPYVAPNTTARSLPPPQPQLPTPLIVGVAVVMHIFVNVYKCTVCAIRNGAS